MKTDSYFKIYFTLILLLIGIGNIKSQNVSSEKINYWELKTKSKIAYYFHEGQGVKKLYPIIYLHGGPGAFVDAKDDSVFAQFAKQGYDVYLYDQIGCGNSERLKDISEYSVERHLLDLDAIIEQIGAKKVILIGHSWGASLVPSYMAKHPEKVYKCVFTGPGGIMPKNKINYELAYPDSIKMHPIYKQHNCLDKKGVKLFDKVSFKAFKGKKIVEDIVFDSLFEKRFYCDTSVVDYKNRVGAYCNSVTSETMFKGEDIRPILKGNNIPILIMLGENDGLPWGCVDDYFKTFNNIKFKLILNAGHRVFIKQPNIFIEETLLFLENAKI